MSLPLLYESLHLRPRPEDVAERILTVLAGRLSRKERRTLEKAAGGSLRRMWNAYASMLQSFGEAVVAGKQLARTIVGGC